ncbi:MltA domain-containing protein [Aquincola sp. S2]|uniref:peptidoglycan lytic exotransglycosylase n=1 Tax=Pseudaquabacterium terrae TaxID=2732868 RepID=A0ABX2EDJ1_9BURK|nr:MltA domain-containing protein [Aquabacterium terrae]NRF66373.1 MltA domain-containing protein [Aquabacterium terrae]
MRTGPRSAAAAILGIVAGCAAPPGERPAPVDDARPQPPVTDSRARPTPPAPALAGPVIERPGARWVAVSWSELPGWADDRSAELWPALRAGCIKPTPEWIGVCQRAARFTPADHGFAREFLQQELQPYRVEARDGTAQGLATGYFEPLIAASRRPRPGFTVPLYRPPADLGERRPYWTRQQLETLPAARQALRGLEIAYVASPLDVLVLQIQGSGRLRLVEPDGRERELRLAFAAHNDQPYRSVGRWLIEQGELRADAASWPAIRDWGQRATPQRLNEMLWSNPRVVFFREEALTPDVSGQPSGPKGAQGVPLTAGRSVAVDPSAVPYGTPLWLDTTEPLSSTPLRRLVMAQDTGGAITGAVRIDYFWGTGETAEQQAGRMKQPLRLWALWPKPPA